MPLSVCKCALSPAKIFAFDVKIKAEGKANDQYLPWAPALCFKVRIDLSSFSQILLQFHTFRFFTAILPNIAKDKWKLFVYSGEFGIGFFVTSLSQLYASIAENIETVH